MNKTVLLPNAFFFLALLCGCDNVVVNTSGNAPVVTNGNAPVDNSTYVGTFTVTYSSGSQSVPVTLTLKDGKYGCSTRGSGTYLTHEDKITFKDENFWTGNFDWNLILNGQYDYSLEGKKLKISAYKNNVGHYEYNMEKQ